MLIAFSIYNHMRYTLAIAGKVEEVVAQTSSTRDAKSLADQLKQQ